MKRLLYVVMVVGLASSLLAIVGCSKAKVPQPNVEPAEEKAASISKKKDITIEPTKKEFSGKEEVIDLGKGVKLEMVLIPAGKFMMGSPASEVDRNKKEKQHEVTLTKQFYIGKYEITQEQWEVVMGNNPSSKTKEAKLPVTDVSYNDCQEFIKKLNSNMNRGYRLPTEAEWEYSCRAGTSTAYSFGDKMTPKDANYVDSKIGKLVAVGSYKPNAFGLFDMHGNAEEWCEDWYEDYTEGSVIDPKGPVTGKQRILRDGTFYYNAYIARSSHRGSEKPTFRSSSRSFRLAKTK